MSVLGTVGGPMYATLLVKGSAPPRPSICRKSGLPKAARTTLSLVLGSRGRSFSRKKIGLLVPPRYIAHGIFIFPPNSYNPFTGRIEACLPGGELSAYHDLVHPVYLFKLDLHLALGGELDRFADEIGSYRELDRKSTRLNSSHSQN